MLFKNINLLDENMNIQQNMYLGTQGSRITYISSHPPINESIYGDIYTNTSDKLLIPGFFNAHSHTPMHLLRGYAENLPLMQWLQDNIFPYEAQLKPEDIHTSCLLGIAECLRFGIVGTTEMYYAADEMANAFIESGLKVNFSVGCICMDNSSYYDLPIYREAVSMQERYRKFPEQRIIPEFSLHAEYTSTEKVARELAETAKKYNSAIHVHVSETADEVAQCRTRHDGKSPVAYLADCGVFDVPTTAAHCVHVTDDDIAILKEKNVSVATCPKSNLKLASGVCPAKNILDAGVNVALGTDSVASNNNLNMLEEMKFFSLIHKGISQDPTAITPAQALYAATRAGALAMRRPDCGYLKEGFKADIVMLDTSPVYMHPIHNMLNNIVYSACGTDVCMTMVDGKVLYKDGEYTTLDIEKLKAFADDTNQKILHNLR